MEANVKYTTFYTYDKDYKIVFDENKQSIPKNNVIYLILEKYKNMLSSLSDILIVPNKSIEEADNNLVYKGKDKKGRFQYCYGINYVKNRTDKKLDNFLKIFKKMDIIQKIITDGLKEKTINKTFLFASILLLELTFYIRLGKEIYLDENETIGLLTLKRKNLIKDTNMITISFKAKSNKNQEFFCYKDEQPIVYSVLNRLLDNVKNDEDYLFTFDETKHFTERMLNKRLKAIELRLKDFRTYGVNILFLKTVYDNLNHSPKINVNKVINLAISDAATIIGHTKNISKKSYLSDKIVSATKNLLEELSNDVISFDVFVKKILTKCQS